MGSKSTFIHLLPAREEGLPESTILRLVLTKAPQAECSSAVASREGRGFKGTWKGCNWWVRGVSVVPAKEHLISACRPDAP